MGWLGGGQHPLPKLGAHGELPPALPARGTATSQLGGTGAPRCASSMPTAPSSPPVPGGKGGGRKGPPLDMGVLPAGSTCCYLCVCV